MLQTKKICIPLIVVLLFGALFRLIQIDEENLWIDEAATVNAPNTTFAPPLYNTFMSTWFHLFGTSELSLRFPSFIFGTLSIFALFLLAKELFDKEIALYSCAFLSISVFHIFFSQEGRLYALLLLLVILSTYYFLLSLRRKKKFDRTLFIVFSSLMIYTHYYGFFILLFELMCLIFLWVTKNVITNLKHQLSSFFIILIVYTPWLMTSLFDSITKVTAIRHLIPNANLAFLLYTIVLYNNGILVSALFLFLALYSLLAMFIFQRTFKRKNEVRFLLSWILIGLFIPFLVAVFLIPIFSERYSIIVLPAFYMLLSYLIASFKQKFIRIGLFLLVLSLSLLPIVDYYTHIHKEQWRDAMSFLEPNSTQNSTIIVHSSYCVAAAEYYYKGGGRLFGVDTIQELKSIPKLEGDVWFILSHFQFVDPELKIKKFLDSKCELRKKKLFFGVAVFKYSC